MTFALSGAPILVAECLCSSCRAAGEVLEGLPHAPALLDAKGATLTLMYRKDRLACTAGSEVLREFRLRPEAATRRIVATCCNSAMLLDFTKGHWIDVYGARWPEPEKPAPEMRTMVGDLPDATGLPDDIPNHRSHSLRFFARLLRAWVAMRFRVPELSFVHGKLDLAADAVSPAR
ncbi:MAG TPA: hypothetical protein VI168_01875 [Croceibacterium sp.]